MYLLHRTVNLNLKHMALNGGGSDDWTDRADSERDRELNTRTDFSAAALQGLGVALVQ
jgi:hypothetical protein